jgi:hypothetical protein
MATRFDSFLASELSILAAGLCDFKATATWQQNPSLASGAAPSRAALLTEIQNAANWGGAKCPDLGPNGQAFIAARS